VRILVVGAGAVGQVYGHHLARGGAQVTFLVKPAHAAELAAGLTLYPLNRPRAHRAEPVRFTQFQVLTDAAAVGAHRWDQVYLTMSSTALRSGEWFAELAGAIGDATLVLLQPGPDDHAFVGRYLSDEQIVQGIITLVSYRAPLPGETRFGAPGIAYWFPPLAASPISGRRRDSAVAALRAGGLPARRIRDVGAVAAFPTALLMPLLAALEQAGWSFRGLRDPGRLQLATQGAHQALAAIARHRAQRAPWVLRWLVRPALVRLLLALAPRIMPLDLETYLRVHFTKVGDQTRDFLRTYLQLGRSAGLATDGLERLTSGAEP
jgi:hypothetical protein